MVGVDLETVTFATTPVLLVSPVNSLRFCFHIRAPLNAFTAYRNPFHDGKYTTPFATAGVADMSLPA